MLMIEIGTKMVLSLALDLAAVSTCGDDGRFRNVDRDFSGLLVVFFF